MDHPTSYLLKKIAGYQTNGLSNLGRLDAKFMDNISDVMRSFAEETAEEVINRLNKGEAITINGTAYALKTKKTNAKRNH